MIDERLLASAAQQLAVRIREDDPQTNGEWLASLIPDGVEPWAWYRALAFAAAAAVPIACPRCERELTWRELTAWVSDDTDPAGIPDTPELVAQRRATLLVDEIAVQRAVAGENPGRRLTHLERVAVIRTLRGREPVGVIATRAGCQVRRVREIYAELDDVAA